MEENHAGQYHFYPPEEAVHAQDGAHYVQPAPQPPQPPTYQYLIPHNPVPVVPSHMILDPTHPFQPQSHLQQQHPLQSPGENPLATFRSDAEARARGASLTRSSSAASASSGAASPPSSARSSIIGHPHRYNPIASPVGSSTSSLRRRSIDDGAYSDDPGLPSALGDRMTMNRKEATRIQRIEAEQRRRDDLREGYAKLRDALPSKNLKGAKVAVLDRATSYIAQLEAEIASMTERMRGMEEECARLRHLNEVISLGISNRVAAATSHGPTSVVVPMQPGHAAHSSVPANEMAHMHINENHQHHHIHHPQEHGVLATGHGIDPADIMPAPHGITPRREDHALPATPSSGSEFTP